ncbi:hypothetical protein Y032_0059g3055 [Ancylostoma ceylanicum]|uniref:Uncharacterized protein n=1 Tax=Ancylostoma ceylanicum TaxID=53326 RepID=A0A016U596_9BILA|nr:hypothetical protein Y032_0059g3055 [Ancylostoma ceylanicum]
MNPSLARLKLLFHPRVHFFAQLRCLDEKQREVEMKQIVDRVEIDRKRVTCSETGDAYPRICFYWIADPLEHPNMSASEHLPDWLKYVGYGPRYLP